MSGETSYGCCVFEFIGDFIGDLDSDGILRACGVDYFMGLMAVASAGLNDYIFTE